VSQIVDRDFVVRVGQTLHFDNVSSGFVLRSAAPGLTSPHLTIAGMVTHSTNFSALSVLFDHESGGLFDGGLIEIAQGGYAQVSAAGTGTAIGYYANAYGSALASHGTFVVAGLAQAFGMLSFGADFQVVNSGTFRVQSQTADAIGVQAMNGIDLTNSGRIEVTGVRLAHGIIAEGGGIIANSGTLIASGAAENVGIITRHSTFAVTTIQNTGTIQADVAILDESAKYSPPQKSAQVIDNSGTIRGTIDLRLGDDVVSNSGLIEGDVLLGYGADSYVGTGGELRGAVHGGFGADHLVGGADDDVLFGEEGDDVIRGEAGDDVIQGGRGRNLINGGEGRDTLTYAGVLSGVELDLEEGRARGGSLDEISNIEDVLGSDWNDAFRGDGHDNLLFGDDGDDVLDGRGGTDVLVGGRGNDILSGGAGDDIFVFGSGDEHDQIVDFGVGDRIDIHGYTSAQSISQVGADTVIRLSATDLITLQGVDLSTVTAGQLVFTALARPSYETAYQPEGFGNAGFTVYETLTLSTGEEVVLDGGLGTISVMGDETVDVRLINDGTIRSYSDADLVSPAVTLAGMGYGSRLENQINGLISVVSENDDAYAFGVYALGFQASVTNLGRIEVTSARHGAAIFGANLGLKVVNEGTISLRAAEDAFGVNLGMVGEISNSGTIDVHGGGDTVIGIRSIRGNDVSNTGEITVSSDGGESVGIYTRSEAYNITNTGHIHADIAIDAAGYFSPVSGSLLNSGQIFGEVRLGSASDTVTNEGLLDGLLNMGQGDDRFDGRIGTQLGEVHGGQGQDRITGGLGADRLFGDEGSDTLEGGLGDDLLNGGTGDDIAVFAGLRSHYSWTQDGSVITMTGPDGTDTLVDIELLRFDDGLVSLTGFGLRITGLGGDDIIHGSELNDVLDGGDVPPLWVANGLDHNGHDQLFGYAGDDILRGGGQNDMLNGGEGNDDLNGGTGNDRLTGGQGNDALNGGDGYDVAVYEGAYRGYASARVDAVSGGREGGNDTLSGMEAAEFVDGTLTFNADSDAAQLMRLYSAAFGREPDALGFEIQLNALQAGVSIEELAARFIASAEFVNSYGTLTDRQFIDRLYLNALDRNGDPDGINSWLVYLANGGTREDLMLIFAESAEHRAISWSTLAEGLWVGNDNAAAIARLYDSAYDRLPDEDGLISWTQSLAGGTTLLAIATTFLNSTEGQEIYGGLTNAQFVDTLYQTVLNRVADSGGRAVYLEGLTNGTITRAEMLVEFSESAEHQAITLPLYVEGIPTVAPAPVIATADDADTGPQVSPLAEDDIVLPGLTSKVDHDGALVLPGAAADVDTGVGKEAGPQVLPVEDAGPVTKDAAGPQVLPGLDDDDFVVLSKDVAGPQVLPVAETGPQIGPQVLPGLDEDDFILDKATLDTTPMVLPGADETLDTSALPDSVALKMAIWADAGHALFLPDTPGAEPVDALSPENDWGWA